MKAPLPDGADDIVPLPLQLPLRAVESLQAGPAGGLLLRQLGLQVGQERVIEPRQLLDLRHDGLGQSGGGRRTVERDRVPAAVILRAFADEMIGLAVTAEPVR